MKMALQRLLRKISFAGSPGIEEMLANDDFTKYTQDDLDRFEEILIQNSEEKCKDMIRSYFKVLSSLAKRGRGDGFFGRVASVFRKMLRGTPDTAEKREESTAAPSKKRRRRSSAGISKRIKREDPAARKAEVVSATAVCVDGANACASHAIRERAASNAELAHSAQGPGARRQRRKMSYGYCPEDLVGKPISPDLFARAINPEYNFLPGLPKLVLGDIPTDDEDDYFRKKEYMSSLSDEYDEKCNFNDGKPYNCRRCVEKEYVDKMEGLGLLGGDAGVLGVAADRRYVHTDDRSRDDVHSLHEKRRKIEGKYYVDWAIKTDTHCAEHSLRSDSSQRAHGVYSTREDERGGGADEAGAAVAERSSAGEAAGRADGDNADSVIASDLDNASAVVAKSPFADHFSDRTDGDGKDTAAAKSPQQSGKNTEEREHAFALGPPEGLASQQAKLVSDSESDRKRHELNASFVAQTLHAPQTSALIETTLETELPKMQNGQEATPHALFADVSKSSMNVPHMPVPESHAGVQNSALSTKENTSPSCISSTADSILSPGANVQHTRFELPQVPNTTETQSAVGLPSIATPFCWSSASAAHKSNADDHSPAKKRDLQTMQSRSSTMGSAFASQKDNQSPVPFSYTQESAMAKMSFLSSASAVKSPFSPESGTNTKAESTHSAHFATRPHDAMEAGRQEVSSFANLFEASTQGAANSQPLIPQGSLFESPGSEASRASREGQDVASRFNRRKR